MDRAYGWGVLPSIDGYFLICVISGKLGQIAKPLSNKQNEQFQVWIYHDKFEFDQIQMANLWPRLTLLCLIISCQIPRPSSLNISCGFVEKIELH